MAAVVAAVMAVMAVMAAVMAVMAAVVAMMAVMRMTESVVEPAWIESRREVPAVAGRTVKARKVPVMVVMTVVVMMSTADYSQFRIAFQGSLNLQVLDFHPRHFRRSVGRTDG